MIIGNNFNTNNNKFQDKMNDIKNNGEILKNSGINPLVDDPNSLEFTDASNSKSMHDKTLAILHERLANGTITLEQFNKECSKLNKLRNKE